MPTSSAVGRIAAVLALIGAGIVVLLLLAGGGGSYTVTGKFENASQLVVGNNVNVAGVPVGSIKEIALADDGEALVKMEIGDDSYTPLPQGTHATVRSQSLSGIANRYVDLSLPATQLSDAGHGVSGDEPAGIESGGTIEQVDTTSEVDLDQLFNTLNKQTVNSLKSVIKGFATAYDGVGPQANKGFYYLNPFLSTSRRVFGELNSDQAHLDQLIVDGASLTSALAERSPDLEALIGNLDQMLGAIGRQESSLASAVGQLPDFMRQFDTTAVNLRAALDDVDPLINATRPVARKLKPFVSRLRGFARDSVPAVKSLDSIVARKGADNDLIELTQLQDPLAEIGVGPVNRNGATRSGALPESAKSLNDGLHQLAYFRPYSSDLVGWFDDFGHSGFPDAFGGIGRIGAAVNMFSLSAPVPGCIAGIPCLLPGGVIPDIASELNGIGGYKLYSRCPGANERGAIFTDPGGQPNGAADLTDPRDANGNPIGTGCDPNQKQIGN